MEKTVLGILLASYSFLSFGSCSWCVSEQKESLSKMTALAKLSPQDLLKEIRAQNVCVVVLDSGRVSPKKFFHWGQIEKAFGSLNRVTKHVNLMGKTLCQGEHEISQNCSTIALAHDAPRSTLLHEYLHVLQMQKDPQWCDFSKSLWGKASLSEADQMRIHAKEWDVLKFLWLEKAKLNWNVEDRVAIASELLQEAEWQESHGTQALALLKEQGVMKALGADIVLYKKELGVK